MLVPDVSDKSKNYSTTLGEYTSTSLLACDRDNKLPEGNATMGLRCALV